MGFAIKQAVSLISGLRSHDPGFYRLVLSGILSAASAVSAAVEFPDYPVYLLMQEPPLGQPESDAAAWAQVAAAGDFTVVGQAEPATRATRFGIGYTFDGLWIGVECIEPDLGEIHASEPDGGRLWREDSVEIAIMPEPGGPVHQFIVSTIGSKWSPVVWPLIASRPGGLVGLSRVK